MQKVRKASEQNLTSANRINERSDLRDTLKGLRQNGSRSEYLQLITIVDPEESFVPALNGVVENAIVCQDEKYNGTWRGT